MLNKDGIFVGQICHIEAAEEGGERFNEAMSDEGRAEFPNLMLMCYEHHVVTNDVERYPVSVLQAMKAAHEAKFTNPAQAMLDGDALDQERRQSGGKGGDAHAESGGAAMGGGGGLAGAFGDGGEGGKAKAVGSGSVAIGGLGGGGGIYSGMPGSDVVAYEGVFAMGGNGGEAPQPDGRGGRGGRSPAELLGFPDSYRLPDERWPGEGGRGANTPAYDGKVATINKLFHQYYESVLPQPPEGNKVSVPLDWLNHRLEEMGTTWRLQIVDGAYHFYEIS